MNDSILRHFPTRQPPLPDPSSSNRAGNGGSPLSDILPVAVGLARVGVIGSHAKPVALAPREVTVRKVALGVLMAVLLAAGCRDSGKAANAAWDALDLDKAGDTRGKVELLKSFLATYPDSDHTGEAVETAVYMLGEELGAPAEANDLITSVLARVRNAEHRREVLTQRLGVAAALGKVDEIKATAVELGEGRELSLDEAWAVAEAAVKVNAWDLALAHLSRVKVTNTVEAARAANPSLSEERVQRLVKRRSAEAAGLQGWALVKSGKVTEGLAVLDAGRKDDTLLFTGNSTTNLGAYRGRALLLAGRLDEGLAALAPEVLWGDDENAAAAFRAAYIADHGSRDGYDDYLWATRQRLAPQVAEFTLPDYAGTARRLSALRNGEVTLLAFWFPT
jgi:hypothetical protein